MLMILTSEDDNKPDESSKKAPMIKTRSVSKDGSSEDPKTAMRRKLFAIRFNFSKQLPFILALQLKDYCMKECLVWSL